MRLLNITVPLIDPSLYIHRFASKLEFEEQTHGVAMTAVRLVRNHSRVKMYQSHAPPIFTDAMNYICVAGWQDVARLAADRPSPGWYLWSMSAHRGAHARFPVGHDTRRPVANL